MEENIRLDELKDKINAVGGDTIMGAMSSLDPKQFKENYDKLSEAVEEEERKKSDNVVVDGDSLEAMKRMGYIRKTRPIVRDNSKIGRNDPCPCGALDENGKPKKYKNCCMNSGKYETTHYE